jgi:hypothetical protein
MSEVRVNGSRVPATVKPVAPGQSLAAQQAVQSRRDGYDTYGVSTPEGDKLVLLRSGKKLSRDNTVTVENKAAQINFVENEPNTFGERFKQPFKSKGGKIALGVGAGIAMAIAAPFGLAFNVGIPMLVIGLGVWGAVGAGVIAAAMAIGGAGNGLLKAGSKPDESLTDGLSKK